MTSTADPIRSVAADPAVLVLDVRTPAEFETEHVEGAVNVPIDVVRRNTAALAGRVRGRRVLAVCQSGPRAVEAQRLLAAAGATDVTVSEGGLPALVSAGRPTVRGTQTWAMERQVRLVAGSIVLGSVAASAKLPRAKFVAAGIGGGLTFSALSNTCTMARILSMLPYNKGPRARSDEEYLGQL